MPDSKQSDDPKATAKAEVLSDAMLDAAAKLAATKLAADSSKENRDFWKAIALALIVGLPSILTAWRVGGQDQKLTSIHTLVNSNMAAQLKISATALRAVATLTKKPDDIAAAELAERMLHEHEQKQATVDAANGKQLPAPDSKSTQKGAG